MKVVRDAWTLINCRSWLRRTGEWRESGSLGIDHVREEASPTESEKIF